MARVTGLEPAASGVTGRRSNQLRLHPHLVWGATSQAPGLSTRLWLFVARERRDGEQPA